MMQKPLAVILSANHPLTTTLVAKLVTLNYRIILADESMEGQNQEAVQIESWDGSEEGMQQLATKILAAQTPTLLFNLFHIPSLEKPSWELTEDFLQPWLDKSFMRVFFSIKAFIPAMLEQNTGHVINMTQSAEFYARAQRGGDAIINQSILVLSECLHHDLQEHASNILVSVLGGVQEVPHLSPQQIVDKLFEGLEQQKFYIFLPEEYPELIEKRGAGIEKGKPEEL